MEREFLNIYDINLWAGGSGPGSLPENTIEYRCFLERFIEWNNITSVVDLGCGDWQFSSLIDWKGATYLGIDCVSPVIQHNISEYQRESIAFQHLDFTSALELPTADLAIIKDVFQHWRHQTILDFLPKLNSFRYVLISNCDVDENRDLDHDGDFRPLNMNLSPFFLAAPTVLKWYTKRVHLWLPDNRAPI